MSLILEALKKLDREKQTPDRGFLIVGSAAWPSPARRLGAAAVGLALLGLVAAGASVAFWASRGTPRPAGVVPPGGRATAAPPAAAPPASLLAVVQPATASPAAGPLAGPVPPAAIPQAPARTKPLPAPEAPTAGALPAQPPTRSAESADPYRLTAISQKDGRPVAVLNDRLVREGDSFDGVRVVRIREAEVEIEVGGRRMVIGF